MNSKVLYGIWLVIELGRDILPTNIFTKFDDYTMKTIEFIQRKKCSGRRPLAVCVPIIRPIFFLVFGLIAKKRNYKD